MKGKVKIILIVICILIGIILLDTIQAVIFNNNPILKIREDYNGGSLYYIDKGILVKAYQYTDGKKDVVLRWEKYSPYENDITQEQPYFFGKVIESTAQYILVEPNEGEEIRKSADKISIGLGENNDMIYPVGTNLKITYTGEIMESYPAQIKATNIEVKSADKFELKVNELIETTDNKLYKILGKEESETYDYDIYCYNVNVEIEIDGNLLSLRDALLNNKISMNEILEKSNKDLLEGKITVANYKDGGSRLYKYDDYTILKCHTIDGNRDVYFGTPEMTINDVK
mgnify:FL=1